VKAIFSFNDLLKATAANIIKEPDKDNLTVTLSTDTRTIKAGQLYLPLRGTNFDGLNFVDDAIGKGASGIVIDKSVNPKDYQYDKIFTLQVDDTLITLLALAAYHRKRMSAKVIAITGSSGKTTTKELLSSMLSTKFNVLKSPMNYNNEIGVSKTLLDLDENTEIVVLEMGMRGPGEIDLLVQHAMPDIALITNAGSSHIGRLGSLENIAKAKCEILNYLKKQNGHAFLYGENELLINIAKSVYSGPSTQFGLRKDYFIKECTARSMVFSYKNESFELLIPGEHNIINASSAIEIGKYLGMSTEEIQKGLKNYKPLFGRWEEHHVFEGSVLINDAYNANPDSMKAAINAIYAAYPDKNKWLILGDMLELGDYEESMHTEIGQWLQDKKIESIVTVGRLARFIADSYKTNNTSLYRFETAEEASVFIEKEKPAHSVILLKASRGIGLEKILQKAGIREGGH
jgi:UDP-N-acetylmuramoyl-tripeptide--D-alanyl-D-alanine ligase